MLPCGASIAAQSATMPTVRPLVCWVFLACIAQAALADTTTRYTVLIQDRPSGAQVTTVKSGGRVDVDFGFKNNGRGPTLREQYRFAADGTLTQLQVQGSSEFGAPVSERYRRRAEEASWQSNADHGSAQLRSPAVYVPADSSLEALAMIVRAALAQPQQRIAALPAGTVRVEKVTQTRLEGGAGAAQLTLYAVNGI